MSAQIHRISDKQPEFPCWLWHEGTWRWIRHVAFPHHDLLHNAYTHWHPDQPEAPTTAPTPAESGRHDGRPADEPLNLQLAAPAQGETPRPVPGDKPPIYQANERPLSDWLYAEHYFVLRQQLARMEEERDQARQDLEERCAENDRERAAHLQAYQAAVKERDEARAQVAAQSQSILEHMNINAEMQDRALAAESELAEARKALSGGAGRIAKERLRHVSQEGWDASHDDTHTDGSLRVVAAILAVKDSDAVVEDPLDRDDWNLGRHPLERRLEIAGALIAAELDRVERRDAALHQQREGKP